MRIVTTHTATEDNDWGLVSELSTTDPHSFPSEHRQQVWPGDSPDPTWWVVVACVPQSIGMSAHADGLGAVPVLRLGPVAVVELDGKPVGDGAVGPVSKRLYSLYSEALQDPSQGFAVT